jgi:hypothetical protein
MKVFFISRAQSLLAAAIFILVSFVGIAEIAEPFLVNIQNTEVAAAAEDECKEETETEFFFSQKTTVKKKAQPSARRKKPPFFFAPKPQIAPAVVLKTKRIIVHRSLLI